MLTLADMLRTMAAPAAVTVLVMLACTTGKRRLLAPLAWALAVTSGYITGHIAGLRLGLDDVWWPRIAQDWLIWLAAGAATLGAVAHCFRRQRWVSWIAWLVVATVAPPLLMQSFIEYHWSVGQAAANLAIMCGSMLVLVGLLSRRNDAATPALWVPLAVATAVTLMMSASQKYGQLGLTLTVALAAGLVIAWWKKRLADARSIGPVVGVVLGGLLIVGHSYAKLTTPNALLLFAAACCTADLPLTPTGWGRGWRIAARVALVIALAGAAAALATRGFLADQAAAAEYDYGY